MTLKNVDPRKLIRVGVEPPKEILRVLHPPKNVAAELKNIDKTTVCGGQDSFVWDRGPAKNLAVTGYCAEPLCIDTGECTGPRWVPHLTQYTLIDAEDERTKPRKMTQREIVLAVKEFTRRALRRGARPDTRSDLEQRQFVGRIWAATIKSIRGSKGWRQA